MNFSLVVIGFKLDFSKCEDSNFGALCLLFLCAEFLFFVSII